MTEPGLQFSLHKKTNTPYTEYGVFFMYENLICAIGTVFAVVGVVAVIYFILLRFIRPAKDEKYYIVTVLGKNEKNACARVSYLLSQLLSTGDMRYCTILAVDCGMSEWQRQSLLDAFGKEKCVVVCSEQRARELLFGGTEK